MKNYIYSKLTSYKIGANQNGLIMVLFFKQNLVSQVSFWGSLYFPSIMWFPILAQVKQNPNFIEGHPFKDIQGPVRLRRHRFSPSEALVAGKKAGKTIFHIER